jgi:CBS domain-containing protein
LNLRPLGYEQNNARLVGLARYPLTSQNSPRASYPVAHVTPLCVASWLQIWLLAADLPFEGTAKLAGMFTRRGLATVGEHAAAARALRLLDAQGFGPVVVINRAGVVMGAAYRDQLAGAEDAAVGTVMRFAVSTVRPSEDAAALVRRMGQREVTRTVVTRPDGTLVGLFFAADRTL